MPAGSARRGIGDQVTDAFSLGWHVAELYHVQRLPGETEPDRTDSLPGIGRLPVKDRAILLAMQIEVGLERLGEEDLAQPELTERLQGERIEVGALKEAVRALHDRLLKTLTARDATVGKAYGLGRALSESMLLSSTDNPASFSRQFNEHRINTLNASLADLKGSLPPYAANAVQSTLSAWSSWVTAEGLGTPDMQWPVDRKRQVGQTIRRQEEIWYGLLVGEIDPLQMLGPRNYVRAAEALLAWIGELAWSFLTSNWTGRVLGGIALAVIVFLIVVSFTGHFAAPTGAAVLLLGTLGVTVGSVVSSMRQVLGEVQAPLWEAQLTNEVSKAVLRLPDTTSAGNAGTTGE